MAEIISYEPFRTVKIVQTFTGAAFKGLNGSSLAFDGGVIPSLDENEYIYDVFYRVLTPFASGDTAGTYIQFGIDGDEPDAILDSTTGILDTMNANSTGFKPTHKFTKATTTKVIVGVVGGTDDVTDGVLELTVVIGRNDEVIDVAVDTFDEPA